MCTGSDYAGSYQVQFTWRLLECPGNAPIICLFSPSSGLVRRYILDADTFMNTEGAAHLGPVRCVRTF
ncbi:hypothetical protein BDFG_08752 [Blastomyces dermatitidis ATCC 26199]|nr:hypothetical protein BDFG_08752 [Blastomyces dermatitidis ATCC 26199]